MEDDVGGTTEQVGRSRREHLQPGPIARELLLIGTVFLLYEAGRFLVAPDPAQAEANAAWILEVQQTVGLAVEPATQERVMTSETLIRSINWYYALMHLAPTAAFLAWLYVRRPARYPIVRTVLLVATGLGFLVHWWVPVAPPRLFEPAGVVDTLALYDHPMSYSASGMGAVTNQLAAMPSFHFGWALFIGVGAVLFAEHWSRWLAPLHPAMMLLAIVATGNHFFLDAIVAGLLEITVALAIVTGCHCATGWPRSWACPTALGPAIRWWIGQEDDLDEEGESTGKRGGRTRGS